MRKNKDSFSNIKFAFFCNLFFSIIEFIGGVFTNSISIISDSIHDLGDALAIFISMVLEKKSRKKPDKNYTFGYLRYSVLGAFFTATILLIGSVLVIYNAILRLINPVEVNYDGMIVLAVIGLIINLIAMFKTFGSNNMNEKVINLHMMEDVLNWGVVLVGSIFMKIFDFSLLDPILSIGIACFILVHVVKNYKSILNIFLEKVPSDVNISKIKKFLVNEKVVDIHHIHIWSMDGVHNYATFHVVLGDSVKIEEIDDIKEEIREKLNKFRIVHSTIEFEKDCCDEKECKSFEIDSHEHHHHHHH